MSLKSKEQVFLQSAWKRALKERVVFEFKTKAGAMRARLALYSAVKRARQGLDPDPEVNEAAQSIEICWADDTTLVMRSKLDSDFMQTMVDTLGSTPTDHEDPAIKESQAKVERMLAELDRGAGQKDGLATEHKPTPFFDRSKE